MLNGDVEFHVRQVIWRNKQKESLRIHSFRTSSKGYKPSAFLIEIAVKLNVDGLGSLDLISAEKTLQVRIGDDLTIGGNQEEI